MNTHKVLKQLPGPGGKIIKAGTEVDASEWRNAHLLVKQRYLEPLEGVDSTVVEGEATFEQRVTNIVLDDLKTNGPIAQALRGSMQVPLGQTETSKSKSK